MVRIESREDKEEVQVSAMDADLLDLLAGRYESQVVETSENGGQHTEADDKRSRMAFALADKIAHVCYTWEEIDGNERPVPIQGTVSMYLDGDERGLIAEAHREINTIPAQRSA